MTPGETAMAETPVIHFYTKGPETTASSRQRAFAVAAELEKLGLRTIVHRPSLNEFSGEKNIFRKARLLLALALTLFRTRAYDTVFLQKTVFSKIFIALVYLAKKTCRFRVVLDLDDATYEYNQTKTAAMARMADMVIAGSTRIREWALEHNQNSRLVPSSVSYALYSRHTSTLTNGGAIPVIGWIGTGKGYHLELRDVLVPIFERMIADGLRFRFLLVGAQGYQPLKDMFRAIKGLQTEFIDELDWSDQESMPTAISRFDIGIMPLERSKWNEGKCAFKAIEYMACGIPTVATRIGENAILIEDSVNGFLADSPDEWSSKLKRLLDSYELRSALGRKGQQTIKERYSFEANIPKLKQMLLTATI